MVWFGSSQRSRPGKCHEDFFTCRCRVGQRLPWAQADVVQAEVAGALPGGDRAAPVAGQAERILALGKGEDAHLAAVAGGCGEAPAAWSRLPAYRAGSGGA